MCRALGTIPPPLRIEKERVDDHAAAGVQRASRNSVRWSQHCMNSWRTEAHAGASANVLSLRRSITILGWQGRLTHFDLQRLPLPLLGEFIDERFAHLFKQLLHYPHPLTPPNCNTSLRNPRCRISVKICGQG